jgi:Na+-driven multidrug efflux pump
VLRASIANQAIEMEVMNFLFIRIWGLPLLYLYVIRNALLVGTNQSRFLIWGTLAEAVVNVVLDYALIYGKLGFPAIGFNGAAYASIVAEASGLVVIYAIIHGKGIHKQFSFFSAMRWDRALFKLIFIQSAPLIAQYAVSITSWEYFYILIEHHGERALAVSNTMRNVIGLFGIFSWAFAATTNTMVSNIIGQGRSTEVIPLIKRITFFSFCISLSLFVLLNTFPELFLGVYNRDTGFNAYAIPVVRVVATALVVMSMGTVWLNAVTGTGNTRINLLIECINLAVYCVYVYLVLEYWQLPLAWGWASEILYWAGMFALAYLYIRSGRWKSKIM